MNFQFGNKSSLLYFTQFSDNPALEKRNINKRETGDPVLPLIFNETNYPFLR